MRSWKSEASERPVARLFIGLPSETESQLSLLSKCFECGGEQISDIDMLEARIPQCSAA